MDLRQYATPALQQPQSLGTWSSHVQARYRRCSGHDQHSLQQQVVPWPTAACSTRQTQWMQWQLGQQQQCRQLHQHEPLQHCPQPHVAQRLQQKEQQTYCCASTALPAPAVQTVGPYSVARCSGFQACARSTSLPVLAAAAALPQQATKPGRKKQRAKQKQHKPQPHPARADQHASSQASNISSSNSTSASSSSSSGSLPELLPYPETMDSCQQQLCDVLQISPSDAELLMLTSPAAATLTRDQLAANWAKVQQLLQVLRPLLVRALLQLPDLLVHPQQTVEARLDEAADVLQVPVHKLKARQAKLTPLLHCQLLLLSRAELSDVLGQISQALGLQQRWQQQVVGLVCDEPRLLAVQQAQLISSVEALEQVCGWPLPRLLPALLLQPRLLVTPAGRLYQGAAGLQQQLRLSEEGLALALRRAPAALLVSPSQLSGLLHELAAGLAVPTEVAADILLQEPDLLLRRPGAVFGVLGVLRSVFKLGPDALLQVVQFDPSLLGCSPGELADSTSRFKLLAGSFKPWAAEYKHLMSRPVNVARALRLEPLRLARLTYLMRSRKAGSISLKGAVSMSGRQFVAVYPGYKAWLAQEYSAGGVPRQYRGWGEEEEEEGEEEED